MTTVGVIHESPYVRYNWSTMDQRIEQHLNKVLHHLYINPLEKCNLKCKICYTRKTAPILSEQQILDFVKKYQETQKLQTITFCGGEVFALAYFPHLVNELVSQGIFVQVITNGTIDKIDQLQNPNFINFIVSIDGLKKYHDANRGAGNFEKSMQFLKKAQAKGFHTEIFSIVTQQNLQNLNEFEEYMKRALHNIPITYHPRKPPAYLSHHPVSNIVGEINGFDFLTSDEMLQVMKTRNAFPPKELGCYQVALVSDGRVYGCCEGVTSIGTIDSSMDGLIEQMRKRLIVWEKTNELRGCLGCTQPEFMCGIKQYLI